MKKFFQMSLIFCGVFFSQAAFAEDGCCNVAAASSADRPVVEQPVSQPERPTGDCWCMYCKYEPYYVNQWRCVEENKYSQVKRCKYVPKYYEVQRCRYVPQYYTETVCRQEPEYYTETVCTPCKKWVCDKKCQYKPRYYWKRTCNANGGNSEAPVNGGCASGQCGAR